MKRMQPKYTRKRPSTRVRTGRGPGRPPSKFPPLGHTSKPPRRTRPIPAPDDRIYVIVTGRPHVGKTTFGEAITAETGLLSGDTSSELYAAAYRTLGEDIMKIPKEELRPLLVKIGNDLTDRDPAVLSRNLIAKGKKVIVGVRRKSELDAVRKLITKEMSPRQGLVYVVWLERPDIDKVVDNTEDLSGEADFVYTFPTFSATMHDGWQLEWDYFGLTEAQAVDKRLQLYMRKQVRDLFINKIRPRLRDQVASISDFTV